MALPHHRDRKDLLFSNELPHHITHHLTTTESHRRSQLLHKLLAGSSFLAAATLFLLSLPDQTQATPFHRHHDIPAPPGAIAPLTFSPSTGTFQLSIFEDLHFGENPYEEWGPLQDLATVRVMNTVLDSEPSTSLVVLNGDLVTGENTYKENSTRYMDQIVEPMVRRGLSWASVYGNHDESYNLSRRGLWEEERKWLGSRTQRMVGGDDGKEGEEVGVGLTNYYLPVYPAGCGKAGRKGEEKEGRVRTWFQWAANILMRNRNTVLNDQQQKLTEDKIDCTTPSLLLWFFDSRGGTKYQQRHLDPVTNQPLALPEENWVHPAVVEWFKATSAALQLQAKAAPSGAAERVIPSIGFVHIPTSASLALQQGKAPQQQQRHQSQKGVDANRQPGINDDVPLSAQGQGWCADGSDSSDGFADGEGEKRCEYGGGQQDVPFLKAIASTPGFMALFSAHDHGNTWCYKWDGHIQIPIPGPGSDSSQVSSSRDRDRDRDHQAVIITATAGNEEGEQQKGEQHPDPDDTAEKGNDDKSHPVNLCFGQHTGYGGYGSWIRGSRQIVISEEEVLDEEFSLTLRTHIRLENGEVVGQVTLNETYGEDVYPETRNERTHLLDPALEDF